MIKRRDPWARATATMIGVKRFFLVLLVMLAAGGIVGTGFFYVKFHSLETDAGMAVHDETAAIIAEVGKLMELPQDELPAVATIADKRQLDNQDFFALAEDGDILIAYATARKVILYRPGSNKIINVAPLSVNVE